MSEISKTSKDFRESLLKEMNDTCITTHEETLVKCKRCGRENKFCQNCGTCSVHYRMYDGDHNSLVFKDGHWKIYMFSEPLCIIRPIHIKAILDSVKIQERKKLLDNNQLDMFIQTLVDDIYLVMKKIENNPNLDRLDDFIQIRSLKDYLTIIKGKVNEFEKINMIMNKGRIEVL